MHDLTRLAALSAHKDWQNPMSTKGFATPDEDSPSSGPNDLVRWVVRKRTEVEKYLTSAVSRQHRLLNLTTIAGACASALSAAPALGGKSFTDWLTSIFGLSSPSWQLVCAAAATCSLTATIATQLLKSRNVEEHVAQAQGVRAKLEMLEVGLLSGQVDHVEASREYMRCIENLAFIHGA